MRILIITAVFPPEPVVSAKISKELALKLFDRKHNVTVLAPCPSRPAGFDFDDFYKTGNKNFYETELSGIEVINLDSIIAPEPALISRLRENYSFGKEAAIYILKHSKNYDRIYVNSWPLFSQYLIARAAKKAKIPYYMHVQDIYPESLANKFPCIFKKFIDKILMPLELHNLKYAERIIAISKNMQSYLAQTRNINFNKIEIVYNWQNENDFIINSENTSNKFTFMYLGNIGPVAGVEFLIKAFGLANIDDTCLVVAGNGANKKKCIQLASTYPLVDIRFMDVPEKAVAAVQHNAHVLLLPVIKGAAKTSIPSKLPAYMFSAKPIVASIDKDSDTANAIKDADCGWIIPPENIDCLKKAFQEIRLMDSEILQRKGILGRHYALGNFSKKKNLEALADIIENK